MKIQSGSILKNTASQFLYAVLFDASGDILLSPTIAAGDFQVSVDGGAFANAATTVMPAAGGGIRIEPTQAQTNGDHLLFRWIDQAGAQWVDGVLSVYTVDDLVTAVWAASTRTLTQSAAQVAAGIDGADITITRGDTMSIAITGLGSVAAYVSLDFTVKEEKQETDDDAIIRIRLNLSGSDDGLLRFNRAAAADASKGSITIDNAANGDITITLAADVTDDLLAEAGLYYDVQLITVSTVLTMTEGRFTVSPDVLRAVA